MNLKSIILSFSLAFSFWSLCCEASTLGKRLFLPRLLRGGGQDGSSSSTNRHQIISETVQHDGWRKLINRRVRLPLSGQVADFEVVGQQGTDQAVLVFCWHSRTQTATLIREYMPSVDRIMLGLAAGKVEMEKHNNTHHDHDEQQDDPQLAAAKCELEEECRLAGGRRWIRLTDPPVVMDKYSTTKVTAYLVLDPVPIDEAQAKPRDVTEEGMQVVPGVSVDEVLHLIRTGQMTIVGSWASLLALEKLRELGEIE